MFTRYHLFLRIPLHLAACVVCWVTVAHACPFCSSLAPTLSDDLEEASVAVIAQFESVSEQADEFFMCRLRITKVIKGDPALKTSAIEVLTPNQPAADSIFWLTGYGEDRIQWAAAKSISKSAVAYLQGLRGLQGSGAGRLEHFLGFLQHSDPLVAADAYNEFADASLAEIAGLRDKLDRRWVVGQVLDPSLPRHRRRLCWTFLSQCGKAADANLFDEAISKRQADATFSLGMDAAISCYLSLGGENALARIERDYLSSRDAEYLDSFSAINAIRVHGTDLKQIPRQRLARALRSVLNRTDLADLVIPDLARWEDWTALERVAELFEQSTEADRFIRQAVVLYVKNCPLPRAAKVLQRLKAVDPKAVELAEASMMLYPGLATVPVPSPADDAASTGIEKGSVPAVAEQSLSGFDETDED